MYIYLGNRLLTGSSCLQLWCNSRKQTEDENPDKTDLNFGNWMCIWHCKTASQVHLMKFSPDGEFFATAGKVNFENMCVCFVSVRAHKHHHIVFYGVRWSCLF